MASIFDVGSSALNSLQRAISTTGNNIANVNTEGYSRQQVEFSSRHPITLAAWPWALASRSARFDAPMISS